MKLVAREVRVDEDEYEAEVSFVWPHPTRGWECLTFERPWPGVESAHGPNPVMVSRRMPFFSGCPGIERFGLCRDGARITFTDELATKLRMERDVSITFALEVERFGELRRLLARIFEGYTWYSESEAYSYSASADPLQAHSFLPEFEVHSVGRPPCFAERWTHAEPPRLAHE